MPVKSEEKRLSPINDALNDNGIGVNIWLVIGVVLIATVLLLFGCRLIAAMISGFSFTLMWLWKIKRLRLALWSIPRPSMIDPGKE